MAAPSSPPRNDDEKVAQPTPLPWEPSVAPWLGTSRETLEMVSSLSPFLHAQPLVYASLPSSLLPSLLSRTSDIDIFALIKEKEGWTVILPSPLSSTVVGLEGLEDLSTEMIRIELRLFSSLDGVGLTAAVSSLLAHHGIACNVVAALRHDHIIVPARSAQRAVELLEELAGVARRRLEVVEP